LIPSGDLCTPLGVQVLARRLSPFPHLSLSVRGRPTEEDKTRQDRTGQEKTREDKRRQEKTREKQEEKRRGRQDKTKTKTKTNNQDKTKTRQDKRKTKTTFPCKGQRRRSLCDGRPCLKANSPTERGGTQVVTGTLSLRERLPRSAGCSACRWNLCTTPPACTPRGSVQRTARAQPPRGPDHPAR